MAKLKIALLQMASRGMDQRAKLRAFREREAVRNQQRKPRSYQLIASRQGPIDWRGRARICVDGISC